MPRILQVAIKRGKAAPTDSSGTASASLFLVPIPPKFQPGTESQRRWPEVGIADITIDLPEERFWPINRRSEFGDHKDVYQCRPSPLAANFRVFVRRGITEEWVNIRLQISPV